MSSDETVTVWQVVRRVRRALAWALALSVPLHLAAMAVPLAVLLLLQRAELGVDARAQVAVPLLAALGAGVALLLALLRGQICRRAAFWMERRFVAAKLAAAAAPGERDGARAVALAADGAGLARTAPVAMDACLTPLTLIVLALLDGRMALVALLGSAAMLAVAWMARNAAAPVLAAAAELRARGSSALRAVRGQEPTVVALGLAAPLALRAGAEEDRMLRQQEAADAVLARFGLVQLTVGLALLFGLLLAGVGGGLAETPRAMGRLLAGLTLGLALVAIWLRMASAWPRLAALQGALQALMQNGAAHAAVAEPLQLPEPTADLSVERASYRAPVTGTRILHEIDFAIDAGDSLGIVGPAGSGKSTLARLLAGTAAPSAGRVRLGGRDVGRPERADIAPHIGYLPQEVDLFPGTVAENIARMAPTRGQGRAVVEAAQAAGCHEMILALPQGYDTEVGEGGRLLSGGQRQRIGLARALFGTPRLLVLDEPNAHLDEDGEAALAAALGLARRRGCSVVIVGQRPGGLEQVEKFLVLDEGRVDLFGTRQQVSDALRQRRLAERSAAQRRDRPAAGPPPPPASGTGGPA